MKTNFNLLVNKAFGTVSVCVCVCWVQGSRSHIVRCITLHVGLAGVRFVFAVVYGIQCHVRKVPSFSGGVTLSDCVSADPALN